MSAFGVEHVSKSYRKLAPKLIKARKSLPAYEKQNMDQRIKLNYAEAREDVGRFGREARKNPTKMAVQNAKEYAKGVDRKEWPWQPKKVTGAMVTAAGNRSKRKGRVLP